MPRVEGGVGGDVGGPDPPHGDRAVVQRVIIGGIPRIEWLRVFGDHHVAVERVGGGDHAAAVAPHILLTLGDRAVRADLIAACLDA